MDNNLLQEKTLGWVNQIQSHLGMPELPKLTPGRRGQPRGCVIANMLLDDCVVDGKWVTLSTNRRFRVPTYVTEFIAKFDRGTFNDLDEVKVRKDIVENELQAMLKA